MHRWIIALFVLLTGCAQTYPYLVVNDQCMCEHYIVEDPHASLVYSFNAEYRVDDGITSRVSLTIDNRSTDTLRFSQGYVRVESRNIPYQMNRKSIALDLPDAPPGTARMIALDGRWENVDREDPWLRIAGEELAVTVKGLVAESRKVRTQEFRTIPRNPHLAQ